MRQYYRNRGLLIAGFLGSVLLWLIMVSPVSAQDDAQQTSGDGAATGTTACYPIDVVFLVDQSSSMGGENGGVPTDPENQRRYAIEAVIDLLADIALDLCPDVAHRIAVVSFGTEAEVDIPLTVIDPDTAEDSDRVREELKSQINVRNLGQTNPSPAFERAAQILNNAAPITDEIRKKVVIFVTDGQPCVGEGCINQTFEPVSYAREMRDDIADSLPFDDTLLEQEACIRDLRANTPADEELPAEERNECLEEYAVPPDVFENSTYVWVILLRNNQSYLEPLRDTFEEIALTHGGELIPLSNNRQEVPTTFRNILEQLTGVRAARLNCGSFAVNPYLKRARLVFYKFDPSVEVSLSYTDVDGETYTISGGEHSGGFDVAEYYKQGANERYELNKPYPGIWQLRSENCDGLDAFYDPIEFDLQDSFDTPATFPQRDRPPYYDIEDPYTIRYELIDESGEVVLQEDRPLFAVDLEVVVEEPDGEEAVYQMEWNGATRLFESTEPLRVQHTGTYALNAIGTTRVHEGDATAASTVYSEVFGTERVLFETRTTFQVNPVTSFAIEVVEPVDGTTFRPIHGPLVLGETPSILPLPIRARIVDRQGQPTIPLDEALTDPSAALRALVTAGGDSQNLILRLDPENPGEFIGFIQDFDAAGDHDLQVELASDFTEEYYPDNRTASVSFERMDATWRFEVISPTQGVDIRPIHQTIRDGWPLVVNPIPVVARLIDVEGEPFAENDPLLDYAPESIVATVTAEEQSGDALLQADLDRPGWYVGEITGMEANGEHIMMVDVPNTFGDFTPVSEPEELTFTRSDGVFNLPATYYAILLAIILFILFRIYRYFSIRSNPLTGELAFVGPGGAPISFGLNSGKNWTVIKSKVLQNYPQLELKKLKVINQPAKQETQDDQDEILGSSFAMGAMEGSAVRVEYETEEGQKDRIMLPPNTPVPYGQGTVFQMEFRPDG